MGATPGFQANVGINTTTAYTSDGNAANYLDAGDTFDGSPQYTFSIWVYTTSPSQGDSQDNRGIFSNNNDSGLSNSWQFAIGDNGYEFKNRVNSSTTNEEQLGTPRTGVWENIVLQKFQDGSNDAGEIWLNGSKVKDLSYNPGGLQQFRVGVDRGTDSSFDGFIDSIQIWEGENVSAASIFAAGVSIPEPSTFLLTALGSLALLRRKR